MDKVCVGLITSRSEAITSVGDWIFDRLSRGIIEKNKTSLQRIFIMIMRIVFYAFLKGKFSVTMG